MTLFDWLIVFVLNGAVIGYGFYLARGTHSSSEWFLGSRSLPWWAVGMSMFATNVDSADLVSVTGMTYSEGIHIMTVYAMGSALGGILASFFVVPAMYRAGFYTNAEYLEARFGKVARILSALIQIQYRSSMLGLMIWSIFLLLSNLIGLEPVVSWVLIVCLVILSGAYTAWGGLKSVVWTDALQGIVMMVGGAVIFAAVWQAVGGWTGMVAALEAADAAGQSHLADLPHIGRYHGKDGLTSPLIVVLGWSIIGSGYWTVNHTQTMRLMGTRSLWDMKMAATFGVAMSLPIMIACALLGVFGRALVPDLAANPAIDHADKMYPYLASTYLVWGMKGLVVAGIVAAAVSTFDSMGSALSAIFTRDVYARFFVSDRDDDHYVRVGRWATVGVLTLGFLYLPFIILQKNMLDAFTSLIPVFVTPLFVIYMMGVLTRAHPRSGLVGLIVGGIYGMIALYARESVKIEWLPNLDWLPSWLSSRWPALCWSSLITSSTMVLATLVWGRQAKDATLQFKESGWLQRSREQLPPPLEHPFQGPLRWWMSPALYAVLLLIATTYVVFGIFW